MPAMSLPLGTMLAERYESGRVLGSGGFGITYLAFDHRLEVPVAVKEFLPRAYAVRPEGSLDILPVSDRATEAYLQLKHSFLEEARLLARFSQEPGIVSVLDFFEDHGTAYLVMMHVDGVTVEEWLTLNGGRTTFEEAVALLLPVMDSLEAVHAAGIIHRDISPDNILVTHARQVRLIDFGAAREMAVEIESAALPGSVSIIFKRGYAPPEQYRNHREELGPWTDIYALAATLYRMITGILPEDAIGRLQGLSLVAPSALGVKIDPSAEQVLLQALSLDRRNRPRSMRRFRDALVGDTASMAEVLLIGRRMDLEGRSSLASVPPAIPPSEPAEEGVKARRRSGRRVVMPWFSRRLFAWMAASILFLLMFAGAYWIGMGGLADLSAAARGMAYRVAGSKVLAFTRLTDDAQPGGTVVLPTGAADGEPVAAAPEAAVGEGNDLSKTGDGSDPDAPVSSDTRFVQDAITGAETGASQVDVTGTETGSRQMDVTGTVLGNEREASSQPETTTTPVPIEPAKVNATLKSGDLDANGIPWHTGDPVPNGNTINGAIAQHIQRVDGRFNELAIVYPEQVVKRVYRIGNGVWQSYVEPLRFSSDDCSYVMTCGYDSFGNYYQAGLTIRPFALDSLDMPQTGQPYEAESYEGMTGRAAGQEQVLVDNTRIHVEAGNQFEYAMDIHHSGTWNGILAVRAVGDNPETVLSFRTSLSAETVQVPIAADIGTEWRKVYFDIPFVIGVQRLFLRCESGGSIEIDWFVFQRESR